MSGSAVDYRKRPIASARPQGISRRDGAASTATWSDQLQAAEHDLSAARAQLERAADGDVNGSVRQVATYAASAASAAQAMGVLIRTLHERLDRVENAGRPAA